MSSPYFSTMSTRRSHVFDRTSDDRTSGVCSARRHAAVELLHGAEAVAGKPLKLGVTLTDQFDNLHTDPALYAQLVFHAITIEDGAEIERTHAILVVGGVAQVCGAWDGTESLVARVVAGAMVPCIACPTDEFDYPSRTAVTHALLCHP